MFTVRAIALRDVSHFNLTVQDRFVPRIRDLVSLVLWMTVHVRDLLRLNFFSKETNQQVKDIQSFSEQTSKIQQSEHTLTTTIGTFLKSQAKYPCNGTSTFIFGDKDEKAWRGGIIVLEGAMKCSFVALVVLGTTGPFDRSQHRLNYWLCRT